MADGGLNMEALGQVPSMLQGVVDSGEMSGFVTLVWRKGEILQVNTVGYRDVEARAPMTEDSIFRIASMTKPITSVAALMLMEEGKLKLDDPIKKWIPELANRSVLADASGAIDRTVPAARDITVEDLMTHRAGIAYGFTSVGPIAKAYDDTVGHPLANPRTPDQWLADLGKLPLSYQPGDRFHYGHSTDVLGFLVARIEGKPLRTVLLERILQPLGMPDTDFWIPPEKRGRATQLYRSNPEGGVQLSTWARHEGDAPPVFCAGGGGLMSTASDYLRFARMLLRGGELDGARLLKPESVALLRANRLTPAQREISFLGLPFWTGQGFGLGVSVIVDAQAHSWLGAGSQGSFGWPGAFGTWWQADPVEDTVILYLIQNEIDLSPDAISQLATGQRTARLALPVFQKAVYAALGK